MKKAFMVFLSAVMVLAISCPVFAAGAGGFLRTDYEIEGDVLQIMGTKLPAGGGLTVTAGTQKDIPASLMTVEEAEMPTTVYCLVDVSGSMNQEQMEQVRGVLKAISSHMKDEDNMVLTPLGEDVTVGELLSDREERDGAIDALGSGSSYTNLYQGLMDSIRLLSTSTVYHRNRCLIVLSDGEDDHQTGATEEEAMEAVRSSTIPVYAVATLRTGADNAAQEYGKRLRSFATVSLGGEGYTPALDGTDSEEAGNAIWNSMQGNSVIRVNLGDLDYEDSRDSLLLRVEYQTAEVRYEDTITLYTADLPDKASLQQGQEPTPEPLPEPEPEPAPEPDALPWVPVAVIVVAVVCLVAVAAVMLRARKKKKEAQDGETSGGQIRVEPSGEGSAGETGRNPDLRRPPAGGSREKVFRVVLTAIGHEDKRLAFDLKKNCPSTLGRDQRADIILDGSDSKLSGIHCEMLWDGRQLYVRDRDSTNGSFVNGVPIQAKLWMPLENSDTLRIGAFEYRIRLEGEQ
ncbi:MAG: FHA domain-containing protein [Muribaculum sp.]|nr:FHA domain-containing protein [Muribaculum sp.]